MYNVPRITCQPPREIKLRHVIGRSWGPKHVAATHLNRAEVSLVRDCRMLLRIITAFTDGLAAKEAHVSRTAQT